MVDFEFSCGGNRLVLTVFILGWLDCQFFNGSDDRVVVEL